MKVKQSQVKPRTVQKWLKKLTESTLLNHSAKQRGIYQLSPFFFYTESNNAETEREKLIRKQLESPVKKQIAKHRATLLADKEISQMLKDYAGIVS